MGPQALPEEWVREDKVVHYIIPKSFVDWMKPKMGETALYGAGSSILIAMMSKVSPLIN